MKRVTASAFLLLLISATPVLAEQRYSNDQLLAYINEKLGSELAFSSPCAITISRWRSPNLFSNERYQEHILIRMKEVTGLKINPYRGQLALQVPERGWVGVRIRHGKRNAERAQKAFEQLLVNCGKPRELFN